MPGLGLVKRQFPFLLDQGRKIVGNDSVQVQRAHQLQVTVEILVPS